MPHALAMVMVAEPPRAQVVCSPQDAPGVHAPEIRLRAEGLTALFGGKAAVREVTLAIPASTVTAIIGPSGRAVC